MKQWKVTFMYIEKTNGANIARTITTSVTAATFYEAQKVVYAQYGRDLRNLSITEMWVFYDAPYPLHR